MVMFFLTKTVVYLKYESNCGRIVKLKASSIFTNIFYPFLYFYNKHLTSLILMHHRVVSAELI